MHDAKGRALVKGDLVLIPVILTQEMSSEDYCNMSAVSVFGRKPDGMKETFGAINTAVVLRANVGDTNDWPELREVAVER